MSDTQQQATESTDEGAQQQEKVYSQADVNAQIEKIAAKIKAEERRKVTEKFSDYDDLKARAGQSATLEERVAEIEAKAAAAEARALRAEIANAHGITAEDRDLFLTGTDEETLTAQAKRLAARESERKKQGNHVPREGTSPSTAEGDERETVRGLFGS